MRWFTLSILLLALGFAQSTPAPLPLSASGSGTAQTVTFVATGPWTMNVQSSAILTVYLYDATRGQMVRTVFNDEVITDTGSFFLYVNAPNASWQLTVDNAPVALTPSVTEPTSVSSSPTPPTTTTPTTTTQTTPTGNDDAATEDATTEAETTEAETTETTTTEANTTEDATTEPSTTEPTITEPSTTTPRAVDPALSEAMTRVPADKLKNWDKHYGYQIFRFERISATLNEEVCSSFRNVFAAQKAFMDAGGPESDIQNLDPDGDGYACSYNPNESYTPPRTCSDDQVWGNGFYRKNGSYRPSGCRTKQ